jgi:CTP synthase (UTP-ammonia lyase)
MYEKTNILERHRHRFESSMVIITENEASLVVCPDTGLVEI